MRKVRYAYDDREQARAFLLLFPVMAMMAASVLRDFGDWMAWALLAAMLVVAVQAFRAWRVVKSHHLAADASGVTIVDESGRRFFRWSPASEVRYFREVPPGVVRLVHVVPEGQSEPETVTLPWHRYRVSPEVLVADLEACRADEASRRP